VVRTAKIGDVDLITVGIINWCWWNLAIVVLAKISVIGDYIESRIQSLQRF